MCRFWVTRSTGKTGDGGFTLLELAVVVVVIGVLFLFAYQRYLDLLVDVEKSQVEQTVGVLRSALGMKVAKLVVDGKVAELNRYQGMNPITLLAEVPKNYRGELSEKLSPNVDAGSWYFNTTGGMLVYRVKHSADFTSERGGLKLIRYHVVTVYNDDTKDIAGLTLRPVEKFSWFKTP